MTDNEIADKYEENTGKVIARRFAKINPLEVPSVLVCNHGPFSWGADSHQAVFHAVVLEEISKMALNTIALGNKTPIYQAIFDKH